MSREQRGKTLILILVNNNDLKLLVGLTVQAGEQAVDFHYAIDGGNDQRDHYPPPGSPAGELSMRWFVLRETWCTEKIEIEFLIITDAQPSRDPRDIQRTSGSIIATTKRPSAVRLPAYNQCSPAPTNSDITTTPQNPPTTYASATYPPPEPSPTL